MDRQADRFESDHRTYAKAYFGWSISAEPITLHVSSEIPHPVLGNGLNLVLKLPLKLSPERCAHTAMELNNIERKEWLRCQMMGSWGFDDGMLQFECFVPNVLHHEGVLMSTALTMAIRAQWVSEQFRQWLQAARSHAEA